MTELYLGGTYRFIGTVYESMGDTVPMNLSTDITFEATLRFHRPDGTRFDVVADIIDRPGGVVQYDTSKGDGSPGSADLGMAGDWRASWLITSDSLYLPGEAFGFVVSDPP